MNSDEIKRILTRTHPENRMGDDLEVSRALQSADQDPGLRLWLDRHYALQKRIRDTFRQLPVPAGLEDRILTGHKIVPLWKRAEFLWAVAASAAALLTGIFLLIQPRTHHDVFENFRNRMVRMVLREYRMDITSQDDAEIRAFLARKGAPSDYRLPPKLDGLTRFGAGRLSWQGRPVSMVCLKNRSDQTLFLFILNAASLRDPPPQKTLELAQINKLDTAGWTSGNRSYLLAVPGDVRRYFSP